MATINSNSMAAIQAAMAYRALESGKVYAHLTDTTATRNPYAALAAERAAQRLLAPNRVSQLMLQQALSQSKTANDRLVDVGLHRPMHPHVGPLPAGTSQKALMETFQASRQREGTARFKNLRAQFDNATAEVLKHINTAEAAIARGATDKAGAAIAHARQAYARAWGLARAAAENYTGRIPSHPAFSDRALRLVMPALSGLSGPTEQFEQNVIDQIRRSTNQLQTALSQQIQTAAGQVEGQYAPPAQKPAVPPVAAATGSTQPGAKVIFGAAALWFLMRLL